MRADPFRVLEAIKRLVLERLGGLPGALYGPIEDALALAAVDVQRDAFQYEDQAALWTLRQQQAAQVMRYRQHLAEGFDNFRTLRASKRDAAAMGLLDERQLDMHIDGQRMAESVAQRYQRPLDMVEGRLRSLAALLDLPAMVNPIGPTRLAGAFVRAFDGAVIPRQLRAQLFRFYEGELSRVMGDLYGQANTLLAQAGYGVAEEEARALPTAPRSQPAPAPARLAPAAGNVAFDELCAMLRDWREGSVRTSPVVADYAPQRALQGRRDLRLDEVVSVASLLQSEPTDVFARALAGSGRLGGAIREHLNEGSRRLGLNPDHTSIGRDGEDAIDLVAMVFEALFATQDLHERCRRLYARLVLPCVKVALNDRGLFERVDHPARRLLDVITEACANNSAETLQERELLDRAALVAQRVAFEYREDLAVFEVAIAELDALLLQQRQRIYLQEERAAQAVYGRERLQHAREQADAVLGRKLAAQPLREAIASLLNTSWRHLLVQVLLRDGLDSARFAEALTLGDALVEIDTLASQANGRALASRLLRAEEAIVACLAGSGLDDTATQHGLVTLVRALAWPDAPRQVHALAPQPTLEDAEERGPWLAGGTDTVGHDPALAQHLRDLGVGDWLRLLDAEGVASLVKIGWISPLTSRRMLVNDRGARVLVASVEELAVLAGDGRLQLAAAPRAFDDALAHVSQNLRRTGARG